MEEESGDEVLFLVEAESGEVVVFLEEEAFGEEEVFAAGAWSVEVSLVLFQCIFGSRFQIR